ncbi:Multimeric flavodoxin WrbA [Paucidesulfovibrio gracilis DSM 16080]|uniref:Multimeric flavodoxin WrbA n=1 Tax=Paucidesulfovibrio gracilis DSM 16080 TaxID=1121449 RepID=A0A1T4W8S0_9BACT|nr:flavodoxin family protein [Paucidesulfovibrio gracilis]SKA73666.1 Multimeric flavodoxin WrbA [Paucidesulfovibrio gracilis DSM 16080]
MSNPIVFQCSHRAQGNSNNAMNLFLEGVREAGGEADTVLLRKVEIKPCRACRVCEKDPASPCALQGKDYALDLFENMLNAPFVFFAAPIYFYHLPSRLKTFIDRSQWVYARKMKNDPEVAERPVRPAYMTLFAGRSEGDKLFEGARLTMKYFLQSFNLELQDPMEFRGFEKIADMERHPEAAERIRALGKQAWQTHAG